MWWLGCMAFFYPNDFFSACTPNWCNDFNVSGMISPGCWIPSIRWTTSSTASKQVLHPVPRFQELQVTSVQYTNMFKLVVRVKKWMIVLFTFRGVYIYIYIYLDKYTYGTFYQIHIIDMNTSERLSILLRLTWLYPEVSTCRPHGWWLLEFCCLEIPDYVGRI